MNDRVPVNEARYAQFGRLRAQVTQWARNDVSIAAIALVGSWARGEPSMTSDIDIVVLAEHPDLFLEQLGWVVDATGEDAALVRSEDFGAIIERRVRLASGLEIEFGFGDKSWAQTTPVDAGTHQVMSDGHDIWHDPHGLLTSLVAALDIE